MYHCTTESAQMWQWQCPDNLSACKAKKMVILMILMIRWTVPPYQYQIVSRLNSIWAPKFKNEQRTMSQCLHSNPSVTVGWRGQLGLDSHVPTSNFFLSAMVTTCSIIGRSGVGLRPTRTDKARFRLDAFSIVNCQCIFIVQLYNYAKT